MINIQLFSQYLLFLTLLMANLLNNLSIYYQNARGLRSKTTLFYRNVCATNYDIIVITETWLLDSVLDAELFDSRYVVFRRDRNYTITRQSRGGGVLIAVRRDLVVIPNPDYHSTAEDLWISLSCSNKTRSPGNLHLCVLYLCNENLGRTFSQQLHNFMSTLDSVIMNNPHDNYLILGDFNMSNINWIKTSSSDCHFEPRNYSTSDEIFLVDEINMLNLQQFNGNLNCFGRILDLALSNFIVNVTDNSSNSLVPIDNHHGALSITIPNLHFEPLQSPPRIKFIYNRADYTSIIKDLEEVNWEAEFSGRDLESAVEFFYQVVDTLRNKYIPTKLITNKIYPIWYNASLKKILKEKYKYLRKFKNYGNKSDEESYKLLRDRFKQQEESCYLNYTKSIEEAIRKNPKHFWSHIKSKSKSTQYPSALSHGDQFYNTGESICNAFSTFFHSSFLTYHLDRGVSSSFNSSFSGPAEHAVSDISSISVSESKVLRLLKKLDPSKSAGPDNLSAPFIINTAEALAKPVSLLFTRSLRECCVPNVWKRAYITPVFKKGSRSIISNYRPISKLCLLAKALEDVVYEQLYPAISSSLHPSQHGFLRGRSTVSNLALLNNFVTEAMDGGQQVDVVYTDYSKAFDRIRHDILLEKLFLIGIRGDLLRWFASYVENRTQAVVINNYVSSWISIPSGVPQGSLLGPLLFVVFVNDISSCFRSAQLLCFADDMKIFAKISSINDAMLLQADLIRLEVYCQQNCLDLNPTKCSVMTFTRKRCPVTFNYELKAQTLSRVNSVRDLGVLHDSRLLFDEHINSIISKATKMLGFLMRNSKDFSDAKTLKILYCSLVRSNLEYASQIWNPRYATYVNRIENVQIKFMRYLSYRTRTLFKSVDYLDFCKKHHILPLQSRRAIADIVFLMKVVLGIIDCPELLSLVKFNIPTRSLRNFNLLHIPSCSTNYRSSAYVLRASRTFNSMSTRLDLDLFNSSVESVRRQLTGFFFSPSSALI